VKGENAMTYIVYYRLPCTEWKIAGQTKDINKAKEAEKRIGLQGFIVKIEEKQK